MLLHANPVELESLYVRLAGLELESLHVTPRYPVELESLYVRLTGLELESLHVTPR